MIDKMKSNQIRRDNLSKINLLTLLSRNENNATIYWFNMQMESWNNFIDFTTLRSTVL